MMTRKSITLIFLCLLLLPLAGAAQTAENQLPPSISAVRDPNGRYAVTLKFKPETKVQKVSLAGTFNNWDKNAHPMKGPDAAGSFSLTLELPEGAHLYKFVVDDENWFSDPLNPQKADDGHEGFNSFLLLGNATPADIQMMSEGKVAVRPDFKTPDWARHVVWYQIVPERFHNGTKDNDQGTTICPWTADWFKIQPWEKGEFYNPIIWNRRYGGDLQGVRQKLDYLQELGVSAIYFTPLFEAPSLHKYDATTYMHIDRYFGFKDDQFDPREDWLDSKTWRMTNSDQCFIDLVKEMHKRGMKVIIDGVFNHVGDQNPAFLDVKKNGRSSRFADWFDVASWQPFKYVGWGGFDFMPEFKEDADGFAPTLRKHIFDVTRRWMDPNGDGDPSDGVDGWRLDVPFMINRKFWNEWRSHVKSVNPDAYITGEIWGSPASWLTGEAFDATMNYDFPRICQRFFIDRKNKITASEFDRLLRKLLDSLPPQAAYVMQNLYDSHDLDRLASQIKNPDRPYDGNNRLQEAGGKIYDASRPLPEHYKIMKLMTAFQMTWLGAPMVYYGNEAGMFGADDPSNRKPMLWKELEPYENPKDDFVMEDMLVFFKRCIAIRNTLPALQTGEIKTLLADDAEDLYAFERFLPNDKNSRVIVVINNSNQSKVAAVPVPDMSEGSNLVELLHSKVEYFFAPAPFGGGRWLNLKCSNKTEASNIVFNGEVMIFLNPKDAAILTTGG